MRVAPEQPHGPRGRADQPQHHPQEVVLPAPFGPRYPYTSPALTVRSTPATAVSSP